MYTFPAIDRLFLTITQTPYNNKAFITNKTHCKPGLLFTLSGFRLEFSAVLVSILLYGTARALTDKLNLKTEEND